MPTFAMRTAKRHWSIFDVFMILCKGYNDVLQADEREFKTWGSFTLIVISETPLKVYFIVLVQ